MSYLGVSYENVERPEIIPDLPKGGTDIQDVPLFWNFPSGQCRSFSIFQRNNATREKLGNERANIFVANRVFK